MIKTNVSFYQSVTWTAQDRPEGDCFDAELSLRWSLIAPWIKKTIECLTGVEDGTFVLKKTLTGFQTSNLAVQSYKVTIKDLDDSQKEMSEFSVEIEDAQGKVFVLAEKQIYKRTRALWIDPPLFTQPETSFNKKENFSPIPVQEHEKFIMTNAVVTVPIAERKTFAQFMEETRAAEKKEKDNLSLKLKQVTAQILELTCWTQSELAVKVGILQPYISMFLRGATSYSLDMARKNWTLLAAFWEANKDTLLKEYGPRPVSTPQVEKSVQAPVPVSKSETELLRLNVPALLSDNKLSDLEKKVELQKEFVSLRAKLKLTTSEISQITGVGISSVKILPGSQERLMNVSLSKAAQIVEKLQEKASGIETPKAKVAETLLLSNTPAPVPEMKEPVLSPDIQHLVDDIQAKMDQVSRVSSIVADVINYPLMTVVSIRDNDVENMTVLQLETINGRLDGVIEQISKGKLVVAKEASVIKVASTTTMPSFPKERFTEKGLNQSFRGRAVRVNRVMSAEKSSMIQELTQEFAMLLRNFEAYTTESLLAYLAMTASEMKDFRTGAFGEFRIEKISNAIRRLKLLEGPEGILETKESYNASVRALRVMISEVVQSLAPLTVAELANHLMVPLFTLHSVVVEGECVLTKDMLMDIHSKLKKLEEEIHSKTETPKPTPVIVPEPVKAKEEPMKVVKSLSDLKKIADLKMEAIHPTGIRIPQYNTKEYAEKAKEAYKHYRGTDKNITAAVRHDHFIKNRQGFYIISKNMMEVSKLTGIHYNSVKRVETFANPPSTLEQLAFSIYLKDIQPVLSKIQEASNISGK